MLRPDPNNHKSVSAELSCFCLSKDLRTLFIATAEIEAKIHIWEVTTKINLGKILIPNVPIVLNLKVAHNGKHLLILGLTSEYYQVIMMVDWTKPNQIIFTRQMLHSLPFKIRDLDFQPGSTRNFVTCGIQHLSFWKVTGENLDYQIGVLTSEKATTSIGQGAYSQNPANQGRFGMALVSHEYSN